MTEFSNKEVIEKLTEYFLESDPKVVARTLAGLMIDLNRISNYESLELDEQKNLLDRMALNYQQLHDFVENGPRSKLQYRVMNSS